MKTTFRKSLNISLLIMLIALALCTLCACNFLDGILNLGGDGESEGKVETVTIDYEGLDEGDGNLFALPGREFKLTSTLNEDAPARPKYKWYVSVDGATKKSITGGTEATLSVTYPEYDEKVRTYTLEADGVKSTNSITVRMRYSVGIDDAKITTTPASVGGVVQQKLGEVQTVTLVAGWNDSALPPETTVSIAWFVGDSETPASTEKTFTYTPEDVEGDTVISLALSDGDNVATAEVTISVVAHYDAVDKVSLSLTSGATAFGELVQYRQIGDARNEVTISANVAPSTANMTKPIKWTVEDKLGTRTLDTTASTMTFTPAYGETYVTAKVDNVVSRHLTIIAMTQYDYDKHADAIEYTYVWEKGVYNSYILNEYDMGVFIAYVESQRIVGKDDGSFLCMPSSSFDIITTTSSGNTLNANFDLIDVAGRFSLGATSNSSDNKYWVYFTESTVFNHPTEDYSPAESVEQQTNVLLNYSEIPVSDRRTSIPADSFEVYPESITNSDMLFRVLSWGYKPTFESDENGSKLQTIYNNAKSVLLKYISDDMTDLEKVTAIYEWIAQTVDYDYALVASGLDDAVQLGYNAFSLEGVFLDEDGDGYGQAVCDGRAKAFVLLAGMEGITAIRVRGNATVGGTSEGHAWNKVLIDVNDSGTKEWYMLDTTWSDRSGASPRVESLNHQYFLVTDKYIQSSHVADANCYNPTADTGYDYYKHTTMGEGDEQFSLYISNATELKKALDYSKKYGVYVELEFDQKYIRTESAMKAEINRFKFSSTSYRRLEEGVTYLICVS